MSNTSHVSKIRGLRLTSLLLLGALLLSACGGALPAGEQQAGVLRVAMQPIVQADPAFISSDAEVLVANHVYDYLVDIDPDNNIQPRLASSWSRLKRLG